MQIKLCWVPSHCNIFGNEQADRIAKRALNLHIITNIKNPIKDMIKTVKKNIKCKWSDVFNSYNFYKIKDKAESWNSSFNKNRRIEIILVRLRLNCVREIHFLPHIQNN